MRRLKHSWPGIASRVRWRIECVTSTEWHGWESLLPILAASVRGRIFSVCLRIVAAYFMGQASFVGLVSSAASLAVILASVILTSFIILSKRASVSFLLSLTSFCSACICFSIASNFISVSLFFVVPGFVMTSYTCYLHIKFLCQGRGDNQLATGDNCAFHAAFVIAHQP